MFKLFYDFETFYDDQYSLRKMTPAEYIADPRFDALGCAFGLDDGRTWWVDGPDLPAFFAQWPWHETFAISHNALFDALILSMRYGAKPVLYGDTLSMARNWISHSTGRVSLDACSKYYGLPEKMKTVAKTKGVNYHMLRQNQSLYDEVVVYGKDDTAKCRAIYGKMMDEGFPVTELDTIDMVVRMAAQPKFVVDRQILHDHLAEVVAAKDQLLQDAQLMNKDNLMSDPKFAAMLLFAGLDHVPTKISKTTGKEQYAFAKTDKEFTELLEHDNPHIQALVAARLGHKSTLEETRTQRFIDISNATNTFPIPLKYSGAHTHRFSGDWSINAQNLTRGGKLRYSLKAPKGHVVVSVDASQIEARFNATLSKQWDLMDQFAKGVDVYSSFAEVIYHHPVNKKDHPTERFVGKTGILSLGYGSSWPVFQAMCRNQGNVKLADGMAADVVAAYRSRYRQIVENWDHAGRTIIPAMAGGDTGRGVIMNWGPLKIYPNAIELPNGNKLRYRDLRHEFSDKKQNFSWMYNRGPMIYSLYGAKLVENVIQALAFVHIMEVAKRVKKLTNGLFTPTHQVHDELIYICREDVAEILKGIIIHEMSKAPLWMPDAPLAAEGAIGDSYGSCK